MRSTTRLAGLLAVTSALALLALGGARALAADGPGTVEVVSGSIPGVVEVGVDGWSGGVWLYQCAHQVAGEDEFWQVCDQSTGMQVDSPATVSFDTRAVLALSEPFPAGTENSWGNGTYDCEAVGATCSIVATDDWQTFALAVPDVTAAYGPLAKAEVTGSRTDLTDGATVMVHSAGHRSGTQAMAYVCAAYGAAFRGACDPIAGSERTIDAGAYDATVSVPRFVWVDDPFGNAEWYDGVNGVSIVVVSAENLASPYWEPGVDQLLTFRNEPLEKNPQLLTVTKVRVNKSGGITVEGRIDCSLAVAQWGQAGSTASVGVEWWARQPVGRKGAVTAHYTSVIQSICSDPADAGPYSWATHPPITSPDIWWVYPSSGGKFTAGPIHVDVQVTGGSWSSSPGADQYLITGAAQWDGKAVKG